MERYNSLGKFLKDKFGAKVYKISLHGHLTCPNRDGSKGSGGCIYCNPESSLPLVSGSVSIAEQVKDGIGYAGKRHKGSQKFVSYFQHYSNTYGEIEDLRQMYKEAIAHPSIVGLAISTRPDCLTSEIFSLLADLSKRTYLWLELGLQSANDRTLSLLNRGHTSIDFAKAMEVANKLGINTCAHIILGLPGESAKDMFVTVKFLNDLGVGGVKLHNLHVLRNTKLAEMFEKGDVQVLTLEEYAGLVVDCLEQLSKDILIHRFNSHSPRHLTIAPTWSVNKLATLNAVHNELERRDTLQGKLYSK